MVIDIFSVCEPWLLHRDRVIILNFRISQRNTKNISDSSTCKKMPGFFANFLQGDRWADRIQSAWAWIKDKGKKCKFHAASFFIKLFKFPITTTSSVQQQRHVHLRNEIAKKEEKNFCKKYGKRLTTTFYFAADMSCYHFISSFRFFPFLYFEIGFDEDAPDVAFCRSF